MGIALFFFCAIGPTLSLLEFSSGSENLNVETVMEMRRGGPWLIPTITDLPRVNKPPITAWTSALFVSPESVAALSNADQAARDAAYRTLAWEIRWPALLMSCLTLALTFEMGRLLAGCRAGIAAAVVAGTSMMFLRYGRIATLDVQLAFWVTAANVFMLHVALRKRWWSGCIGAGVCVAMAFLSKGPVALAQTIVPIVLLCIWARFVPAAGEGSDDGESAGGEIAGNEPRSADHPSRSAAGWLALAAGVIVAIIIAVPWFAWVLHVVPGVWDAWWRDVTREGATTLEKDAWYNYAALVPFLFPWSIFMVVGLIMALQAAWRGSRASAAAVLLVVVPIVIMSFFRDKPSRYLQPMLAPAGVLVAIALQGQWKAWRDRVKIDRFLAGVHWVIMGVMVVGLPLAGAYFLTTATGQPWFGKKYALVTAALGLAVLFIFAILSMRRPALLLIGTAVLTLGIQPVFLRGYSQSLSGRAEMKQVADYLWANADGADVAIVEKRHVKPPTDIYIYLNRVIPLLADYPGPADRPQFAVFLQKTDRPPQLPAGWRVMNQWNWGPKRKWYVARLPATTGSADSPPSPAATR